MKAVTVNQIDYQITDEVFTKGFAVVANTPAGLPLIWESDEYKAKYQSYVSPGSYTATSRGIVWN